MEEELLTVSAVARRIGVAPATLRTWDRRYGLGPSSHESGSHRRYCPSDVAKLALMRRLITTGVAPADAAEQARVHKGTVKIEKLIDAFEVREELVESIYRAAKILDKSFIETALKKDISDNGVICTWTEIIVPLLFLVGNEWEEEGSGIEVEHMLSELLKRIMREAVPQIINPKNAQPVLLAAVGEEMHCLALHALAAALAERKIETFFLGARTPFEAIDAMVRRAAPPAIFLWAQLSQNSDSKFFRDLPSIRPAPRVIVGGPGWDLDECTDVVIAHDLPQACAEIEGALGL